MKQQILENIGQIIGAIILLFGTRILEKINSKKQKRVEIEKEAEKMIHNIDCYRDIKGCLNRIQEICHASKVYILSYHNGTVTPKGVHYYFISMLLESDGGQSFIDHLQRVPASNFLDLMNEVHNRGYVRIKSTEQTHVASMHRAYGIIDSHKFRIGDSIANGSLSIVYSEGEHELTQSEYQLINDYLIKIEILLNQK